MCIRDRLASCFYSLKALFGADIPATSGIFRVFDVVAPKGSLVNPIDPAPLGLTINAAQRLPDVIFGALADVAGDRAMAGCNSTCQTTVFTREDPKRPGSTLICHEAIAGGSGASRWADGLSAVQVHMTNTSNMPIEAMETELDVYKRQVSFFVPDPDVSCAIHAATDMMYTMFVVEQKPADIERYRAFHMKLPFFRGLSQCTEYVQDLSLIHI